MPSTLESRAARAAGASASRRRGDVDRDPAVGAPAGPDRPTDTGTRPDTGPTSPDTPGAGRDGGADTPGDAAERRSIDDVMKIMQDAKTGRLGDVETKRVRQFISQERSDARGEGMSRRQAIEGYGPLFKEHFNIENLNESPLTAELTGNQIIAAYDILMQDRLQLIEAHSEEEFQRAMQERAAGDDDGRIKRIGKRIKQGAFGLKKAFVKTGKEQEYARQLKNEDLPAAYLTSINERVRKMEFTQAGNERHYVSEDHAGLNRAATRLLGFSREARTSAARKKDQKKWKEAQAAFETELGAYRGDVRQKFREQILASDSIDELRGDATPVEFADNMATMLAAVEVEDVRNRVLLDQALARNENAEKCVRDLEKGGKGQKWWKQIKSLGSSAGAGGFAAGVAVRAGSMATRAGVVATGVTGAGYLASAAGGAVAGAGLGAIRGHRQRGEQLRGAMAAESEKDLSTDPSAIARAEKMLGQTLSEAGRTTLNESLQRGLTDADLQRELSSEDWSIVRNARIYQREQNREMIETRGLRTRSAEWAKRRLSNLIEGFEHAGEDGAREVKKFERTLPAFAASMERLLQEGAIAMGSGEDRLKNQQEIADQLQRLKMMIAAKGLNRVPGNTEVTNPNYRVQRVFEGGYFRKADDGQLHYEQGVFEKAAKRRQEEQKKAAIAGAKKGAAAGAIGGVVGRGAFDALSHVGGLAGRSWDALLDKWQDLRSEDGSGVTLGPDSPVDAGGAADRVDLSASVPDDARPPAEPVPAGDGPPGDTDAVTLGPDMPADEVTSDVPAVDTAPPLEPTPFPEDKFMLAVVGKGEGVEHVLIRQLKEYADAYGYDQARDGSLSKWAGRKAHEIAIQNEYVENVNGEWVETRVRPADTIAYVLDPAGTGNVIEALGELDPNGQIQMLDMPGETNPYEYNTELGKVEITQQLADDVKSQISERRGPVHINGSESVMREAMSRAGEDLDKWELIHNPDTNETWAMRVHETPDYSDMRFSDEPVPRAPGADVDVGSADPSSVEVGGSDPEVSAPDEVADTGPVPAEAVEADPGAEALKDVANARVEQIFEEVRSLVAASDQRAELEELLAAREEQLHGLIDQGRVPTEAQLEDLEAVLRQEMGERMAGDAALDASDVAASAAAEAGAESLVEELGLPERIHFEISSDAEEFLRSQNLRYTDGKLFIGRNAMLDLSQGVGVENMSFTMNDAGQLEVDWEIEPGVHGILALDESGNFVEIQSPTPDEALASSEAPNADFVKLPPRDNWTFGEIQDADGLEFDPSVDAEGQDAIAEQYAHEIETYNEKAKYFEALKQRHGEDSDFGKFQEAIRQEMEEAEKSLRQIQDYAKGKTPGKFSVRGAGSMTPTEEAKFDLKLLAERLQAQGVNIYSDAANPADAMMEEMEGFFDEMEEEMGI